MPIKSFRPVTPTRRFQTYITREDITKDTPEKRLVQPLKKQAGRNNQGRISVRHQGGGHKRAYRIVDFKRNKPGVPARVAAIEYDPNRSARIALLHYRDGDKRYIVAPNGLKVGDMLRSGVGSEIRTGNVLPLRNIPVGTLIHSIELQPGRGAQMCRSAGAVAQLMARDQKYCQVRLPSGEVRYVLSDCSAAIGQVGNLDHENRRIGKAGRSRWLGKRPTVRGSAMNPRDHPHGGGEGRAPIGGQPQTPWGKPALGQKTRRNKRTEKMIVRKRGTGR